MRSQITPEVKAALKAALAAGRLVPVAIASFALKYAVARFWTGGGPLSFLGATWKGMGQMAGVGEVEETAEVRATGTQFSLSGVPLLSDGGVNLAEYFQFHLGGGGLCESWLGLFDTQTGQLTRDPRYLTIGRVDSVQLKPNAASFDIVVGVEGLINKMNKKCGLRLNDESQRSRHPGDRGFEFTTRTVTKPDNFG